LNKPSEKKLVSSLHGCRKTRIQTNALYELRREHKKRCIRRSPIGTPSSRISNTIRHLIIIIINNNNNNNNNQIFNNSFTHSKVPFLKEEEEEEEERKNRTKLPARQMETNDIRRRYFL
jgi:hypothetical protein